MISVDYDEESIQVFYSKIKENTNRNLNTNVVLAAFVTSHARLKRFNEMLKLNNRLLYVDTDSIFYINKEGLYSPSLGDYLGEFKNEIDIKKGKYIKSAVFAYTVVKGVSFNLSFLKSFNFT